MIIYEFGNPGIVETPDPSPGPWRVQARDDEPVKIVDVIGKLVATLETGPSLTNARVIVGALQRLEEVEVFLCLLKAEGGAHDLELDDWLNDLVGDIEGGGVK